MAEPGAAATASIAIGQTVAAYAYFLPRLSEVRRDNDDSMRADVMLGQVTAGAVSISVGGMLSYLTGSSIPLWTTIGVAVIIAAAYQYAMADTRPV